MQTPLILVSSRVSRPAAEQRREPTPRQDYIEIARHLQGELAGYSASTTVLSRWTRHLERRLKLDVVESIAAVRRASKHNVILSASEKVGIPLAILLSAMRRKPPHVLIAHKLSSGIKTRLWQTARLQRAFSRIICLATSQAAYATRSLGLPESRVQFLYDKVDQQFFCPLPAEDGGYILAVGQEQRDYATLLGAIAGTGIKLIVVASSPWSTSQTAIADQSNVTVMSHIPYTQLRDLYAQARLIVVPLFEVDYAAGVNALLEGMAMAKPVIVTRTRGIHDYVIRDETGMYVTPGDALELKETIMALWQNSTTRRRLGHNARVAVELHMNLDCYARRVAEIVQEAASS